MSERPLHITDEPCAIAPEALYGTGGFQARIWHLPPRARVAAYPTPGLSQSRNWLISGHLNICRAGAIIQAVPGESFELLPDSQSALENPGNQPVVLLEVCRGQDFMQIQLPEVTETRPWGSFTVLKDESAYKLKQLMVKPGNRLSLQRHQQREEHWLVVAGEPEVTLDNQKVLLGPGDYIRIPRHSWHRITNPGLGNGAEVEIIELQLGTYFGEDDIERCEDDYGRA